MYSSAALDRLLSTHHYADSANFTRSPLFQQKRPGYPFRDIRAFSLERCLDFSRLGLCTSDALSDPLQHLLSDLDERALDQRPVLGLHGQHIRTLPPLQQHRDRGLLALGPKSLDQIGCQKLDGVLDGMRDRLLTQRILAGVHLALAIDHMQDHARMAG